MNYNEPVRIEVYKVNQKPDYMPLARHLLDKIIEFYKDPENERKFQEWKKQRDAAAAAAEEAGC